MLIRLDRRNIIVSKTPHLRALNLLKRLISLNLSKKQTCHIALAGGKTPLELYRTLSSTDLRWEKVYFYLGDERYVSIDSELSNYRSIRETLGHRAKIRFFKTELEPEECAMDYSAQLPENLDIALLGLGEDGHTASLFEKITLVTDRVCLSKSPDGLLRVSLTDKYLSSSCVVVFFFTSERKKEAFKKIINNVWPAGSILGVSRTYIITDIELP